MTGIRVRSLQRTGGASWMRNVVRQEGRGCRTRGEKRDLTTKGVLKKTFVRGAKGKKERIRRVDAGGRRYLNFAPTAAAGGRQRQDVSKASKQAMGNVGAELGQSGPRNLETPPKGKNQSLPQRHLVPAPIPKTLPAASRQRTRRGIVSKRPSSPWTRLATAAAGWNLRLRPSDGHPGNGATRCDSRISSPPCAPAG